MANINKLKGKMVEKGYNVETLAKAIKIDKATLYRKIAENGDTFTIEQACNISRVLELSIQEIHQIFFTDFVA